MRISPKLNPIINFIDETFKAFSSKFLLFIAALFNSLKWLLLNVIFALIIIFILCVVDYNMSEDTVNLEQTINNFLILKGNILLYFLPFSTSAIVDYSFCKFDISKGIDIFFYVILFILIICSSAIYIEHYFEKEMVLFGWNNAKLLLTCFYSITVYSISIKTITFFKPKIS